jgi:hypothetical protein
LLGDSKPKPVKRKKKIKVLPDQTLFDETNKPAE